MDSLGSNIASACPSAFSSTGGELFLRAVTTVIAAHCSVVDRNEWPPDMSKEIIKKSKDGVSYDFIVVGAGTAGSLVASQLSNIFPSQSVLLVEAGDDPGVDSEVPAFLFLNQASDNDWKYKTEPDGLSCLGFENNSCTWSKGKGMGGSSSINAMLYIRGHPKDFTDWGESWGYNSLLPYFKNQEKTLNISDEVATLAMDWYEIINGAWKELKFATHDYKGNEALIGTKIVKLLTKKGKRINTAKIYLQSGSKNLYVMKRALAEKITIDLSGKKASGLKIRQADDSVINVSVTKDIILSAGSIATPQLLIQSGIGLKHHLKEKDIPCIENLPVGQNLQDHLTVPLFLKTNKDTTILPETIILSILQYMLNKSGLLSGIGITDFVGFINTNNASDHPDIQFHHIYYPKNDKTALRQYLKGIDYKKDIVDNVVDLNNKYDLLGIYPTLLHPKSKGAVMLVGKEPNFKSKIITNSLKHPADVKTLIKAIKFVHKLESTNIFGTFGIEILNIKLKGCTQYTFDTDLYWECYIRHMATTIYHPVGTAKMGDDETCVVDKNLLVRGLRNLRIADASIMPSMPGANIMATTLVIAQKAADIIKMKYSQKLEL